MSPLGGGPDPIFRTGDAVRIHYRGRWVDGVVELASTNGQSLALVFDAMLGGYLGGMACLWVGDRFVDLIEQESVEVTAAEP